MFEKFAKAGFLLPFSVSRRLASSVKRRDRSRLPLPSQLGVRIPQRFFEMAKGLKLPGNTAPEDWDNVHDFIMIDELSRCGST